MNTQTEFLTNAISDIIINDMISSLSNSRNNNLSNRQFISSRYYNDPPQGGYQINEEHDYILPDNDDLSSSILLEVVTRFGNIENEFFMKNCKRVQIKSVGKYKKIKSDSELLKSVCPICIEDFR